MVYAAGLAIAWENARLHGGSIDVASHRDGGALFTLRLPLEREEDRARAASADGHHQLAG